MVEPKELTQNDYLELIYFQITDLWKRLCEEHSALFNLTCDEYSFLLESDVEGIERVAIEKQKHINTIGNLDVLRKDIIVRLNKVLKANVNDPDPINSVTDLLRTLHDFEERNGNKHLFRFNQLLIDIIEKLQEQNKKNQLFLNKAIISLRDIREGVLGKNYKTYNHRGSVSAMNTK